MNLKQLEAKIIEIIETEINPILKKDGGGVKFVRYDEQAQVCEITPTGNCKGCPLWMMTLRAGIERILIDNFPQIRRIETV